MPQTTRCLTQRIVPDLKAACDRNPCIDLVLTHGVVMLAISVVKLVSTKLEIPILVGMESSLDWCSSPGSGVSDTFLSYLFIKLKSIPTL